MGLWFMTVEEVLVFDTKDYYIKSFVPENDYYEEKPSDSFFIQHRQYN
jgi:hypothetical protein